MDDESIVVDRDWDREFREWRMEQGPKPGPHPYDKHLWNIDPDRYIEEHKSPNDWWW